MTKIMLVEDDKSLREIYGVRLLAEGYDIVSAGDGEEALAMAIKERPQLIVSDVMMPKISGFDMLDILRSTTETRNIKVIMMTALSSEEQRQRGELLGADRYLVKSQVGIEDVVRVVHEVLADTSTTAQAAPAPVNAPPAPTAPAAPVATAPQPQPATSAPTGDRPQLASPRPVQNTTTNPVPPSLKSRIIQPLNDPAAATVDMKELLDKELAKEAGVDMNARPTVTTTDQEKDLISQQLNQFEDQLPDTPGDAPLEGIPSVSISNEGDFTGPQLDDEGHAIEQNRAAAPSTPQPTAPTPQPVIAPQPAPAPQQPTPAPVQPIAPVQTPSPAPAAPTASAMPTPISFVNPPQQPTQPQTPPQQPASQQPVQPAAPQSPPQAPGL